MKHSQSLKRREFSRSFGARLAALKEMSGKSISDPSVVVIDRLISLEKPIPI